MAYLPWKSSHRRSRSAAAILRPATADGDFILRDHGAFGVGPERPYFPNTLFNGHLKSVPHLDGIPPNGLGDNWSLTPSPSLTARRALAILESPRIYEELYGSFHPIVYQRDTLLHASTHGLLWPTPTSRQLPMGSGSRTGVVPMQDYYYDTPYYPQAYAYEEPPSSYHQSNAYLPSTREIPGYPSHHLSNPYLNASSYHYGYGGSAAYYPSRPPPRRSKSSLGFYHEPSALGTATMTGDERLWATNDPPDPSSMKYRPNFHSLPRSAVRNQRRAARQQQFWANGSSGAGLDPGATGVDAGYPYSMDPRRSTGTYQYQQAGTQWDREYANFRSSMPDNLNHTRDASHYQNYPPSYFPNPFYHSDLEQHPYSSYPSQSTTADPYGTSGRRYRSSTSYQHQQDDPYGINSTRYGGTQYPDGATYTANGRIGGARNRSASSAPANRMSEYHDVPSRSGSMYPQGQSQYLGYGSGSSYYPSDYTYQGGSNPQYSTDMMDRTAQLLEDMHLGRGTTLDPYDLKRGTTASNMFDLKRAEYIRRNQQQRSYFDPSQYTPRARHRGDWTQSAPQVWDEKDLEILAMEKMLDDQNALQPSTIPAYPPTTAMGGHHASYPTRQSGLGFQHSSSDPYYASNSAQNQRYHSTGALDGGMAYGIYPKPRSRSYTRRSGRRTSQQRSRSKQTRFEDPLLNKLSSMSKR
eukprot:maker-scaffold1343_size46188-snap-gene-0.7 protein:Tk02718 transcript:maker-scaffold1343_size46188-snap-gene-0.7-mRNA-1 annotation:"---NA---"